MSTNYFVLAKDLEKIFEPYTSGTKAALTGYKVGTQDLRERFAKYAGGTKAAVTGYKVGSVDLNAIFAKSGTVDYSTPDDGMVYNASFTVPNQQQGTAGLVMQASNSQYTVGPSGRATSPSLKTYNVPAGMAYVKAILTYQAGTQAAVITQTTAWLSLTGNLQTIASMLSPTYDHASGSHNGQYACALQFSANGSTAVYTGSTGWIWLVDGSV